MRLLVIEDDTTLRESLTKKLAELGFAEGPAARIGPRGAHARANTMSNRPCSSAPLSLASKLTAFRLLVVHTEFQ